MEKLNKLIESLIILCNSGAIVRLIICLLRIAMNFDELASYKKKMKNLLVFIVLATSCLTIKCIVEKYYM